QTRWTRQLEKGKEEQPERFAEPFVANETRFPLIRNVRVGFVIALVSVMLEMVDAETYGAGEEIRQVGHDRGHLVQEFVPENEIMRCVVDDDVGAMVRKGAGAVGYDQTDPPGIRTEAAHRISDR